MHTKRFREAASIPERCCDMDFDGGFTPRCVALARLAFFAFFQRKRAENRKKKNLIETLQSQRHFPESAGLSPITAERLEPLLTECYFVQSFIHYFIRLENGLWNTAFFAF